MPPLRPVFLHVGLPKTGTTFLQRVLGECREPLRDQGLLYPGTRNDHFFEAQDVLRRPFRGHEDDRVSGSWQALLHEVDAWPGACLISHELFTAATTEQVRSIVAAFGERPLEVIVTARDLARQLTANWQETVKNGEMQTLAEYVERARGYDRGDESASGFWYWQDLVGILQRWREVVPADRTHLVTVPPRGTDPSTLWQRFTAVIGVDLSAEHLTGPPANASLGRVETEFLRRLNADLADTVGWTDYRTYVKQFLAQRALPRFPQSGPIALAADDQIWAASCSREMTRTLAAMELDVHGDLTDLESPNDSASGPVVTDEALADVGVRAITQLLRRIAREQDQVAAKERV